MTPIERERQAATKAIRFVRVYLAWEGCKPEDRDAATCAALATALQSACAMAGIVDWKKYVMTIGDDE